MHKVITKISLCCFTVLFIVGANVVFSAEADPEWIPLFNGKNLDGWEGSAEIWSVKDGCIVGNGPTTYKQYLVNRSHILTNFVLEVKFMPVKGNSGVNYRCHDYKEKGRPFEVSGYQCDIGPMGALYDIYTTSPTERYGIEKKGSNHLVDYKGWNTFRIVADGKKLSHYINDKLCMEFEDNDPEGFREKGFIALEYHDKNVTVRFKDIRVRELPTTQASPLGSKDISRNQGPVAFVIYKEEKGQWITWKDNRLSLRIPKTWTVIPQPEESGGGRWTYTLRNDAASDVFNVTMKRGGPEFIACFCAPIEDYQYSEKPPYKFWALLMKATDTSVFTFKAASKTLRLDVHAILPKTDADRIQYIAQSARTIEREPKEEVPGPACGDDDPRDPE